MKRIFCLILCAVVMLNLAGCGARELPQGMLGTVRGSSYRNSWLKLGCILPEGWSVIASDSPFEDGSHPFISEQDAAEILHQDLPLSLFAAESANGQTRLFVSVRDYGFAGSYLTAWDAALFLQEELTLTLTEEGCTILSMNCQELTFAGEQHAGLVCMATEKQRARCVSAVLLQYDRYIVTVLATGKSQTAVNQALAAFYSLNAAATQF